jgi:hypothetical protein
MACKCFHYISETYPIIMKCSSSTFLDRNRSSAVGDRQGPRYNREEYSRDVQASDWSNSFSLMTESMHQMRNAFQTSQIPQTIFTVNCGELRAKDEGVRIKIAGKVIKRPRAGRFLEIKDMRGCTQLVATDDKPEILVKFHSIPADSYISVIGTVQLRPVNFINNVSSQFSFSSSFH